MKCIKMTCLVFTRSRGNPSNVPITPAAKPDDNNLMYLSAIRYAIFIMLNTNVKHLFEMLDCLRYVMILIYRYKRYHLRIRNW